MHAGAINVSAMLVNVCKAPEPSAKDRGSFWFWPWESVTMEGHYKCTSFSLSSSISQEGLGQISQMQDTETANKKTNRFTKSHADVGRGEVRSIMPGFNGLTKPAKKCAGESHCWALSNLSLAVVFWRGVMHNGAKHAVTLQRAANKTFQAEFKWDLRAVGEVSWGTPSTNGSRWRRSARLWCSWWCWSGPL